MKASTPDLYRELFASDAQKPKYGQIQDSILTHIRKGQWAPGDRVPPERKLAEMYAASVGTVRNALQNLVRQGYLSRRQGQGTFVSSPDSRKGNPLAAAMATEDATLDDLLEVRMGLECNAAMLAALRATESDILSLERCLEEMIEALEATDKISTESDAAFHMAVAFATKNPVLIHLMRNFYDFLFIGIKKNLMHMYIP